MTRGVYVPGLIHRVRRTAVLVGAVSVGTLWAGTLGAAPVEAQRTAGLRTGASWSKLSGTSFVTTSARLGLAAAGFVRLPLAQSWAIQVEAGFSQKGIKDSDGDLSAELSIDYVQFPLLLQYVLEQDGQAAQFYAGGAFNRRARCSLGVGADGVAVSVDCDEANTQAAAFDIADTDVAWVFGIGWQSSVSERSFLFDVRGEVGQSDGVVIRDGAEEESNRNLVLVATVGVAVPWGR